MIGPGVVTVTARHVGGDYDDSDHGSGLSLAVDLEIWTIAGSGLVCYWDWHGGLGLVAESG
jgi:hypothetical protein